MSDAFYCPMCGDQMVVEDSEHQSCPFCEVDYFIEWDDENKVYSWHEMYE